MRNPERIDRILKLIEDYWKQHPDMRLTQLIMNALNINEDPYYYEDSTLEQKLIELSKRSKL
jgi:uncharacterized protein YihD (DUF1040 family)